MELFGTQKVNQEGILTIGDVSVVELAKTYGTPLYVMDESLIRSQCRWFKSQFKHDAISSEVIYASKAFLTLTMAQLIQNEGLSLDVVSGGELYTAIKANFPMDKVYFHGNNKSKQELQMALSHGVGTIIIDQAHEFELIQKLIQSNQKQSVLLRINPGIEAHTHEYIKTTKNDSKFGLSIFDPLTEALIVEMNNHPNVEFLGFHSHIGSQIFEKKAFNELLEAVFYYAKNLKDKYNIDISHINLGGGFGVKYTDQDQPIIDQTFLPSILERANQFSLDLALKKPTISIEPGRAIVANAGVTLYEVGTTKQTYGKKNYVFVDGSMADHIRTVLYQAQYHAVLANRMHDPLEETFTITGKACESGDIIIRSIELPFPKSGDLLAVFTTGAYHYSMSSNYNRLLKPAVVFVKDGTSKVVVKRETYEDLLRNDVVEDMH